MRVKTGIFSLSTHLYYSSYHYAACEITAQEPRYPFILYSSCHSCHQHVMVHPVKELFNVEVCHIAIPGFHMPARCLHCKMTAPSGTEPVAVIAASYALHVPRTRTLLVASSRPHLTVTPLPSANDWCNQPS